MIKIRKKVLPGFSLSLGLSVFYLSLIVLLPAITLAVQTLEISWDQAWFYLTDPRLISAFKVTFSAGAIATFFNGVFGLILAWILVRYDFPGKKLVDSLIDLPFALPTAVAGLTLASLFAQNGWLGRFFVPLDIKISYTFIGIVVAMIFTSIPFVVRIVQPVLEDLSKEYEEAASSLGANKAQVFCYIIFPHIRPALLIGLTLSFIRCLGEFGAIIFIAGNMPYKTEVISLMIFTYIGEFNYAAAALVSMVILILSLILLLIVQLIQSRYNRQR